MAGFRYELWLAEGEPADPPVFTSSQPSGFWKIGDVVTIRPGVEFRIVQHTFPVDDQANGAWIVEPIGQHG